MKGPEMRLKQGTEGRKRPPTGLSKETEWVSYCSRGKREQRVFDAELEQSLSGNENASSRLLGS